MKTPRREQPWYEIRLENNKKPRLITDEERTILTDENRRLIEESASILAWGVKMGLISYPKSRDTEECKATPLGSSIEPILPSSLNSSAMLSSVWPSSEAP